MAEIQQFLFSPFHENTYVVHENGEAIIIDPGCFEKAEEDQLTQFLKDKGLTATRLINTHCHLDHIFGNRFVREHFKLPLEIHPEEKPILEAVDSFASAFGVPAPNSPAADRFIHEGDKVQVGQTNLEVLLTPGHSPGHISLFSREGRYILSADVLFQGGIGRTDLPGGNYDVLINTIQEKLLPLGEDIRVYPGHGPITTIGEEKASNPFLQ